MTRKTISTKHQFTNRELTLSVARSLIENLDDNVAFYLQKTAAELGIFSKKLWPEPKQIEQAISDHMELFASTTDSVLNNKQPIYKNLLSIFCDYSPIIYLFRILDLVPLINKIYLQLTAPTIEDIARKLINLNIPYEISVSKRRIKNGTTEINTLKFFAGETEINLFIFSGSTIKPFIIDPLTGQSVQHKKLTYFATTPDIV